MARLFQSCADRHREKPDVRLYPEGVGTANALDTTPTLQDAILRYGPVRQSRNQTWQGEAAAEPNEAVVISGSAAASPYRAKEFFAACDDFGRY